MSNNFEPRVARIPSIRPVGRPRKWEVVADLEADIEDYFKSCFMVQTREVKIRNGEETEIVDEVVLDRDGNERLIQIRPFTVTGLAVHLDTTRETLLDYENKEDRKEFSDTIKKAKQIIENFNEESLHRSTQVAGIIFSLKNNFKNWVDRTETDITTKGDKIQAGVVEAKAKSILENDQ